MKKIVYCIITMLLYHCAGAQADSTYQLLWYKGKKIKPNVLLTSAGDTIRYNPQKGEIKLSYKKGAAGVIATMQQELSKNNQRINEHIAMLAAKTPAAAMPVISTQIKEVYNRLQEKYKPLLQSNLTLPKEGFEIPVTMKQKGAASEDDPWEAGYKKFRDFMEAHKDDALSNLPVPPRRDFTYCYECDSAAKKTFTRDMEWFKQELRRIEEPIMNLAFGGARQAEFLLKGDDYKKAMSECAGLIDFVYHRQLKKVLALIDRYIDDPYRCAAVLEVALDLDRFAQLSGFAASVPGDVIERGILSVLKLVEKALDEKDYSIGLNLNLFLELSRQAQLATGKIINPMLEKKFLNFNQFKMETDISAKASVDGGYTLAHLQGYNWFFAIPGKDCKLQWVLVGPFANKMSYQLLAAEFRGKEEFPYAGTKNWESNTPSLHLEFCRVDNDGQDSIIHYPIQAQGAEELWTFPQPTGTTNATLASGLLLSSFFDQEKLQQQAKELKDPVAAEKLKKKMLADAQKAMNHWKGMNVTTANGGYTDVKKMDNWYNVQQYTKQLSELMYAASPGRYIFEPVVHNKEEIIIQAKLNGKELFPDNAATEYAWFHLILRHNPTGPFKITF